MNTQAPSPDEAGDGVGVIYDGQGIAVVGEPREVRRFLSRNGCCVGSRELDLGRLSALLSRAAELAEGASRVATVSGRWVKLTPQSAKLVAEHGLMKTEKEGICHLMIGDPGRVARWLQAEGGVGVLATNPAILSGIAGLMAQAAKQQAIEEILDYLAVIDQKLDEIRVKIDDTVMTQLGAARSLIERAKTRGTAGGGVGDGIWSQVQGVPGMLAQVQEYALKQLDNLAAKLESEKRFGRLKKSLEVVEPQVRVFLRAVAESFELQEAFDVIEIERALGKSAEDLDGCRAGLETDRSNRVKLIEDRVHGLLARMGSVVAHANNRVVWDRDRAAAVIGVANEVARHVIQFLDALAIPSRAPEWKLRQLLGGVEAASRAIQVARDKAPLIGGVLLAVGTGMVVKDKVGGQEELG